MKRVSSGDNKLNLDLVRSVKMNCKYAANSFKGTGFRLLAKLRSCVNFVEIVCQFRSERSSRNRVFISPRSCVDFARCSLEFGSDFEKFSPTWRIVGREILLIQQSSTSISRDTIHEASTLLFITKDS